MNIVLWVVQAVLALKLASTAYTHALGKGAKMRQARQRLATLARPLLGTVAILMFLGALGLVLPAAIRSLGWLIPWAAALLALMMLISLAFHRHCCAKPKLWADLILCALAAFVAVGRWVLVPL